MLARIIWRIVPAGALLASYVTATTLITVDGTASHAIPPLLCESPCIPLSRH